MHVEETIDLKSIFLPQGKNINVKVHGNLVRKMGVRRRSIFPALHGNRQY